MNCLAINACDETLIVDCGVLFPAEPRMGIDTIHPDFTFLLKGQKKIVGLVVTHGHEDHIAAIPYLLRDLNIPVFAGKYTIGLLSSRLAEFDNISHSQLSQISPEIPFKRGGFTITPIQMPHSTIDNLALVIECAGQRLFHTSDFKLSVTQPDEHDTLIRQLQRIKPIDLMITDSTGALEKKDAGDEDSLLENIGALVSNATGRVFVALFSSNVQRISTLVKVARQTNRKLILNGRSVLNHYAVARETGRMPDAVDVVVPVEKMHHFCNNQLLIIMSGTQGESRSALGRFAANRHSQFTAEDTDTVILSSRFIPGNELQISQTISRLMAQKVVVFHANNCSDIHVSGHGSQNEIKTAIETVAPRALLPAHGTYEHLQKVAEIARQTGIPHTLVATNGDVVTFFKGQLAIHERIESGRVYIDNVRPVSDTVLKERRKLGNKGIYIVWIQSGGNGKFKSEIQIAQKSAGVMEETEFNRIAPLVERKIRDTVAEFRITHPDIKRLVKIATRRIIRKESRRDPVFVVEISPDLTTTDIP
ncbi:MAG: ribonuclease J [Deltaproteobacteria bacterium]|nr:ribonuclease J [Deltaproteobacteria bacterium]